MTKATDIARIGTLPDDAFLPDGTGGTNVKSLKGVTEQSIKDSIGNPIGGAFDFAKDGLIGLLAGLVGDLLGTVGDILKGGLKMGAVIVGGVIELGSNIIGGAINAVGDLFGWVGSGILSLFNRKAPAKPLPPVFSEIRADLEGEIAPFLESVDKGQENARLALEEADALKIELGEEMVRVDNDIALANSLIAAVGDVDQKIADQAAIHIRDAEAALGEAKAAQQALTSYKEAVDPKIQSALADSEAGLDRLDTLEPKVSTVISDLAAYEEATNAQIQDLLGKASGAITDAGQALTQYDTLLGEYEGFKTEASDSLEALRKSSTTQGQKIGTIEGDLPGIKTSITNVFALAETAQATVDNLEIGGRNLATRRNFALNTQHQQVKDTGEVFWTGEPIYHGLKLTTSTPPIALSRGFRVEPGETYTATLWVKGANLTGSMNCNILMYDTRALQSRAGVSASGDGSEWKRIVVTVTNDTAEAFPNINPYFYLNRNAGEETWFTSPKVERGNRPTDWTPAPEDTEADIAAAREKADQAALDAEKKAEDARIAAELYAKEKSEADAAQALVDAKAEAARLAKAAADQAVLDSASDADVKLELAEAALKAYTDAQADAAKEAAEATAAADASTKANQAKVDAEAKAATLAAAAQDAAATALSTYKGVNDPKVAQAQKDAAKGIADALAAKKVADQATLDAASKAEDARIAAELYAKEKSEADAAQALVDATAEAARVAKAEADAAKTAAATDATNKVAAAQTTLKAYAEAQAASAKEGAEANAALDATTKANAAKVAAEKEAKRLSDLAAAAAATAQATADQAKADAESKANAAREAAELYAKEKSEADAAQALVDAKAEAARVAQEAAAQAVLDSASDADAKVALAESALKAYAEAQATAAQEAAEATAALDATNKANKAKKDAEANAKKLSDAAAASAATAQATADQAKLDATNKAADAQAAAQNYAKEKAEAERAIAEENAAKEALRVAQAEATAAKDAAATDAKAKADEAERLAKLHADAQAALAKEQAEANAALDATEKANKAKADAEANAKILSDKAQKLAEEVKYTADTTAGKIPGIQDSITTAHSKAEAAKVYAEHVSHRGDNLVLNGFGELGDNTYFNSFTYIADDAPLGVAGSFEIGGGGASFSERVPVDLTQELTVSCYLKKASDLNQRVYFSVEPYDVDGFMISPQNWMETAGTRAQLARPLKKGDTELHLVDANSAAWAGSNMRGLIVWNYTDSRGKTWEPGTYSRNYQSSTYQPEGVNGNVITLTKPWGGVDAEAGTWVGCGRSGGTYLYPFTYTIDHTDWRYYEGVVGGSVASGTSVGNGMPAATVAIRPRFLLTPTSGPVRVAGISMSYRKTAMRKAAAAQEKADQATLDAVSKAEDARIAAELYAKEKSEADVALAEERAAAEALRVAQLEATAAKDAAAVDAKEKADEAERLAKLHADAQAKLAKEGAEANAALDATEKANKAKTDAEKEAKRLSDIAAAAAAAAQSTANQAKAAADVAVTKTVVEYAVGASETTAPTTGWSTSTPTRTPGSFVWMRSRITYGSGTTTVTSPALLTGNAGATGAAGKGITTTVISYATSASGTTTPTSGWVSTLPTVPQGHYLWTRTATSYTSGSPTNAYAVTRQGADGTPGGKGVDGKTSYFHTAYATNATGTTGFSTTDANGKTYVGTYSDFTEADSADPSKYTWQLVKGADGADGKGVKTSVVTYAASTNGKTAPASGWVSTIPTVAQGSYLWTRTVTTFTDGATTTVTAPSRQGVDGGKGDQGVSVTSVTPYYRLIAKGSAAPATPTIATPSGWTTTEPGYVADRELFRADKVAYSNSAFTWTDVSRVSAYTAASQANDKLPGMQDAITTAHGKAEEAQRNLDNLQIGGRNLIPGTAHADKQTGQSVQVTSWGDHVQSGVYSDDLPPGITIGKSEHRTATEPGRGGGYTQLQEFYLEEGQTYTISFWGKCTEDWNNPDAYLMSVNRIIDNRYLASAKHSLTTEWKRYSETFTVPAELSGRYRLRSIMYEAKEIWTSHPKLEVGHKVTDWTPAPEDTEAEIKAAVQTSADALNTYRTSNDKAVSDANDAAAAAAGVAQAKGEVIYQSTAPTGARASTANLWIRTSDNKPHTYNGTKWIEVTDKVAADAATKAATALSTAQAKTTTYYGSSAPTGTKTAGDLWLDSGSDNALKRWSGSAWVEVRDGQLAKALKAAGDAQSTADGKVRSFAQSAAPTGMSATDVGDIWLDTDDGNKMYRWSGSKWVTMQDHLAVQAKSVADTATTKAETAQSTVDNLQIGGRNLLQNSKVALTTTDYNMIVGPFGQTLRLPEDNPLVDGEEVTVSIKGQIGEGKGSFLLYNSGGTYAIVELTAAHQGNDGVYRRTTTWKGAAGSTNSYIYLYQMPAGVTAVSTVEWIKIERGNKATDWSPAPEDVDKSIANVDYKASETEKLIPGMQDSITTAHSKAEAAQSTVDNLQIGGRNLIKSSNDFSKYGNIYGSVRNEFEEGVEVPEWGATDATRMKYTKGTSSLVLTPSISHLPSETVTFSYWLKNVGTTPLRAGYNGLSPHVREVYEPGFSGRVTFTGKMRDDYSWFQHQFYVDNPDDSSIEFVLWRSKLEVGTKATDWTPAPEDVDAEIEAQANALAGYQLSNDVAVDAAKKAAQDAAGLAGGKGEVIYSTTTPPTAKRSAANLWIKGPKNTPHVWNGSAWVEITDQAAKDAAKAAADANTLAETKTTTYYQTSAPTGTKTAGDLWIDQSTAGKNTLKRWSGSAWVVVQDKAIQEALTNAATAQSTADGKVRTFSRTTEPPGMTATDVGDLWIDTDDGNKLYRWSGTAWVGVQDAAIAAAKKAADDAAASQMIKDTRNANEPPLYYWQNYTRTTVREFKFLKTVDAGTTGYGIMTTVVPWTDSSGGAITQEFNVNNSDTVLYRRSTGAGATATWTAWKDRAKDLADSITALGNDLATKTGPTSTLQKNINALDEATGKQYEDLNKQLWGDQGELNKLNSLLWDDQGKLNQATEIFKSNITGWQTDVYNAFVAFDNVNKRQDGLVAANNRAIKANTEAVSAHQRILQVAYPDSGSAIPMVPGGVNVGTADAPVYEAMPEWLHAFGVTTVTGAAGMDDKRAAHSKTTKTVTVPSATKVKVNPTALYRYSFWIQASASGSEAFIRLYDQNGSGAVLENIPDAGVPTPRASGNHLFWFNVNVPTSWTKISGTIRLKPDVTHVYIQGICLNYTGTITSQWLADIQLEPIIPSQSEVNRALSEVNDAQTAILSSQQDVLDMAFPNTNLVPMTNGVPEWTSAVAANPIRTPEGNWRFTSATAIQPGTGGKHVPTVNEVTYRAMVRVRRTGSGGTFSIRLRKAGGATNVSLTAVTGKPAPAGASRLNFLSANQTAGTDWTTWYYDFTLADNTGDVRIGYVIGSTGVEVSQLSVVALLPSQGEVDAAQNTAIDANTKAISLAFPDRNFDPQTSAGRPEWSTPSTVTIDTTGSFGGYKPTYKLAGATVGGYMDFQADIREYRFRAMISPGSGSAVAFNLSMTNPSGQNMVEAWRVTFPSVGSRAEYLAEAGEMAWTTGTTVPATAANGLVGVPGEWAEIDVVIRLKAGENRGRLQLSSPTTTNNWVILHKPRLTMFSASQWQVDYTQNKALDGLSRAIELQGDIDDRIEAAVGEDGLGGVIDDLKGIIDELRTFIPRTMFMDWGSAVPVYNNDHFKVDNNNDNIVVRATGSWTGRMAVTYGFGAAHETYVREYPIPFPNGDRFTVVTSQKRANREFARIDYWIDKGEQGLDTKKETVNASVGAEWTTRSALTFTVEDSVSHQISYKVVWPQTSKNNKSWGLRIKRNGTVLKTLTQKDIGPTWPWEDGRRSQDIAWKGVLTKDDTITFEVYTGSNNTSDQRKLESAERLISWIKKTS